MLFARHSGESRLSTAELVIQLFSFDVIPAQAGLSTAELVIQLFSFDVIPAQAGIHFDLLGKCRASTRPAGERVTFFACAKKVTKESTPQAARSPGILPSEFASALRGSLNAHPCAYNELARIVRATLRAFPPRPRRAAWGPVWAASCRRSQSKNQSQSSPPSLLEVVQGWTDSWIKGAVRGAEHRRRGGTMPAGSRRWIAAIAKQYRDVLSEQPRRDEKHRGFRFAGCESEHRARRLAFCLLLGNAKSRPLARRASGSFAPDE